MNDELNTKTIMRLRLVFLRWVCWLLLPRDIWVGKYYGAYLQEWEIHFGRLDNRGVLQGVADRDIYA